MALAPALAHVEPRSRRLASTLLCGGLAAAVQTAIVLPFLGRYGWDRDELYFVSAARRPALGYVDFPPVTAWIAWLVRALFGESLDALRVTSLAAMTVTVVLVALVARELGAGLRVQAAAAFAWALSPYLLGAASLFHPTWFDSLCWVALLYVVVLALDREQPRLWLAAGAIAGIGLETKYTIAFLLVALLAAFGATDGRRAFRTRWPWLGLAVALALFAPNLVWQARHGWPSIAFAGSQNAKTASDTPPGTYLAEQLFLGGGVVLAAIGVVVLWRRPRLRPLSLVPPLVTLFFLLERGRAYYPLPADAIAVAAGVVGLAGWLRAGGRRRLLALVPVLALHAVTLVLALPVVVPVRSTSSMIASGVWQAGFYDDEIGWPELADQTARAWAALTPAERANGAIVAENYGEASALERYGPPRGLPPVLSGHLSWQYWRPRRLPQTFVLFVGYDRGTLSALCRSWRPLARVDNSRHLDNDERGRLIAACRLTRPLGAIWHADIATDDL
ncbi:MAG TPA: glycosyltransferase family 39 protein [Gaiellaceae bacterium]|nr:glycosyltransferase family 39 protein [Gaiellaceae bacterium]